MSTRTHFEKETKGNSEMAHSNGNLDKLQLYRPLRLMCNFIFFFCFVFPSRAGSLSCKLARLFSSSPYKQTIENEQPYQLNDTLLVWTPKKHNNFTRSILPRPRANIYILLTKREGCTGRISAQGLDSMDQAVLGPYKKDRGPIFCQYGPEQAWLIRDLLHDWRKLLRFFTNYGFHLCYLSRLYSVFPLLELGTIIRPAFENF